MNITDTPIQTPAEAQLVWLLRVYHYQPSPGAAIFGCAAMGVLAILLFALTLRFKGHYMWIVVVSAALESVGYGVRIATVHSSKLGIYIISALFLIVMPIALAFVNYYVMGRILKKYGRKMMFLKPSWIAGIFLVSDVLSFVLQGGASGLLISKDAKMNKIGRNIIIAGFIIQLTFFACFIWLTLHATIVSPRFKLFRVKSLRMAFIGLWTTIGCIFIRNIYRAVDYISPTTSAVATHEWPFYVFEFGAIALSLIFYSIFHWGRLIPLGGQWVEDLKAHKQEIKAAAGEVELEPRPAAPSQV